MFCPKCATENPDNGKFCRSCGADLSNVLAVVEGSFLVENAASSENSPAELYSTSIRNIILGLGFLLAGFLLFTIPPREGVFWLLMMIPGFFLLASGISRWIKADALKKERSIRVNVPQQPIFAETQPKKELPPTQTDYVKPQKSIYETEDLMPQSVTEETTRQLEIKAESKTMTLQEK
ncbi:MAG TPA: zinc ribbon domain-containing protein [Pyrinomonadaceae bacterium]|nr:zinc ribbon domain-containing protein [Pyrinomonadaceae bacterium]